MEIYFLTVLEAEVQDQGSGRVDFLRAFLLGLWMAIILLPFHLVASLCMCTPCVSSSSCEVTSHVGLGSTLLASFQLHPAVLKKVSSAVRFPGPKSYSMILVWELFFLKTWFFIYKISIIVLHRTIIGLKLVSYVKNSSSCLEHYDSYHCHLTFSEC